MKTVRSMGTIAGTGAATAGAKPNRGPCCACAPPMSTANAKVNTNTAPAIEASNLLGLAVFILIVRRIVMVTA
jgi:hypothetical protein